MVMLIGHCSETGTKIVDDFVNWNMNEKMMKEWANQRKGQYYSFIEVVKENGEVLYETSGDPIL